MSCISCCAGTGSQLLVYNITTGKLCLAATVLSDGAHVHGIHSMQQGDQHLLVVHGDRHAKVKMAVTLDSTRMHLGFMLVQRKHILLCQHAGVCA